MKVLTFTTLFPNREQPNNCIFIKNRVAALNRCRSAEVRVVAPVPYFPRIPVQGRWGMAARIPRQEEVDGLVVSHPRYLVTPKVGMMFYGYWMFLGSLPGMRKIFREWPFDVIDSHYVYPDGFAAVLLGRHFRRPVTVSARGTDINVFPRFRLIRPLIRKVLQQADQLISVCDPLAELMVENGGDKTKIAVIPNGVDRSVFYPRSRRLARRKIGLPEEGGIILSVGSLIEIKGMHLLLEAMAILKDKGFLDFRTFIIGKGPYKSLLEKQIAKDNLQSIATLVGEVTNESLGDWYNAADLFFLGTSSEGWPNVISEALACGTPVISTKVSGIPQIVSSGELGILSERSPQVFAEALRKGFERVWNRDEISAHGRKRTWQTVAEEIYDLYSMKFETHR